MATDPIRIPIITDDKATADLKKVAAEADRLDKKKVKVGVDTDQSTGIVGKLKGFIGSIGPMAAGAGAAVGTIGAAVAGMVGNWQALALEVGHFRDATGTSADEASRFVELAKDMGLGVDTVQGMIGKLNKAAANTPDLLHSLGVEIAYARDGTTDVQATFLNAVDAISAIQDPTEQAAAAAQLFGKNWQAAAELVTGGADAVRGRLAGLKGSKLVSDEEIERAKKVRDQYDRMRDSLEELSNIIGEKLAPALGDAAEQAGKLGELGGPALSGIIEAAGGQLQVVGKIGEGFGKVGGGLKSLFDQTIGSIGDTKEATHELTGEQQAAALMADGWGESLKVAASKADGFTRSVLGTRDALDRMRGALDMKHATDQLVAQVGGAMLTVGSGAKVASDDVYAIKQGIIDVAETADASPIVVQSAIDAVDRGDWDQVYRQVQGWAEAASPVSIEVQARLKASQDLRQLIGGGGAVLPGAAAAPAMLGAAAPAAAVGGRAVPVVTVPVTVPNVRITVNAGMVADTSSLLRALTRSNRTADRMLGIKWRDAA